MQKFKVTSNIDFPGMPKSIASRKDLVVEPIRVDFFRGNYGKEMASKEIHVTILSRVFISDTERIAAGSTEEEAKTIEAEMITLNKEYRKAVDEHNANPTKITSQKVGLTKTKQQKEGSILKASYDEKIAAIDHSSYFTHETVVFVDTVAKLSKIEKDPTATVKLDAMFSNATTEDII